ncbi:hypothetical protein [Christiangramia sabulilitoris]|uniref:Lipoprotein n=1 Tax=Christiangramia sabulilitoris TaxID=2583991 RepID=A0A550I776_9FLAO|nr:hypothetical protein [Christiangramia sabulilitoris]TRO66823.1 hypothetical protein FGM01_02715 [Christiangramia sabulilitoris]
MRTKIKSSSLILLILTIIGCGNIDKKEKESKEKETYLIQMEFGKLASENSSLGVELKTNQFNNWVDLVERAGKIVCNDSLPKITLKIDNKTKTIYFRNPCWEDDSYKIIKQKNVIEIYNNKIFKNRESIFPIDSLKSVLKRDIENNGGNPMLSENSEKLMVFISYDKNNGFKNLSNTLNQLTETYYGITNKTDIKIWLTDKEFFNPPPRPEEKNDNN